MVNSGNSSVGGVRFAVAPPPADDEALIDFVSSSSMPVGVVKISSRVVVELSASAAELLGAPSAEMVGADLSALTDGPDAMKRALALLADGAIDRYESSRHFTHQDGTLTAVNLSVQDLRPLGYADRALLMVSAPESAVADSDSRLARISADVVEFLHGLAAEQRAEGPQERVAELEDGLTRIAHEIEELGLGSHVGPDIDSMSMVASADLTSRQHEVVRRLVAGERVPSIARSIFLSQSTVRNHLLAVFRKFGVHSQAELIEKLRGN